MVNQRDPSGAQKHGGGVSPYATINQAVYGEDCGVGPTATSRSMDGVEDQYEA